MASPRPSPPSALGGGAEERSQLEGQVQPCEWALPCPIRQDDRRDLAWTLETWSPRKAAAHAREGGCAANCTCCSFTLGAVDRQGPLLHRPLCWLSCLFPVVVPSEGRVSDAIPLGSACAHAYGYLWGSGSPGTAAHLRLMPSPPRNGLRPQVPSCLMLVPVSQPRSLTRHSRSAGPVDWPRR